MVLVIKNGLAIYLKQLAIFLKPKKQEKPKQFYVICFITFVQKFCCFTIIPMNFKKQLAKMCP